MTWKCAVNRKRMFFSKNNTTNALKVKAKFNSSLGANFIVSQTINRHHSRPSPHPQFLYSIKCWWREIIINTACIVRNSLLCPPWVLEADGVRGWQPNDALPIFCVFLMTDAHQLKCNFWSCVVNALEEKRTLHDENRLTFGSVCVFFVVVIVHFLFTFFY